MDHFGDPSIVVNAFINQLEAWRPNNGFNKKNFVSFASFLKCLVQSFEYLGFKADLQSSTLMKKAKEKISHNILIKLTEYTITSIGNQQIVSDFQKWLEVQAQVYDKINRENVTKPFNNWNTFGQNNNNISRINSNNDKRNSNAINQFSNHSQNNWKENSLHSSRPANQHGQPPFLPRKDADQSNKSCEKCKGSHILATCPDYQKCAPDQRYDIVSKNNFFSNCLSNKHFKQSCSSTKRFQSCKGFHHTTLHDPSKQVKRPIAVFSTSNPNQPTQNLASPQIPPSFQQQNQNKSTDTVSSKKSQHTTYGQSFSCKQQSQNIQRAHLNASNPIQKFSFNRNTILPPEWYEQLQILPISIVNGSKVFDTYALIYPGSQFTFLLDKITSFLELPCEAQESTILQYLNTQHEMPLAKISETLTVTPFDKVNQQFSIARAYSTPCFNGSPANVLELNQLCDTFKELSDIYFLDIANGAIGALLGVNTFAFTYPVDVIQGSKERPFGVKTKLGWSLAGEYELSHQTMNTKKPPRQPFI